MARVRYLAKSSKLEKLVTIKTSSEHKNLKNLKKKKPENELGIQNQILVDSLFKRTR